MMTNISLLFILSLIITFSFSQENEEECKNASPNSRNNCFAIPVPNGYCCFYLESEVKKCTNITKGNSDAFKDKDCGITDEYYGKYEFGQYHPKQGLDNLGFETCGKSDPKKKEDCTDYSEISNSCCLFSNVNTKGCLHIGRKYIGNNKKTTFSIEGKGEFTVECKSFNVIYNLHLILLIALFL